MHPLAFFKVCRDSRSNLTAGVTGRSQCAMRRSHMKGTDLADVLKAQVQVTLLYFVWVAASRRVPRCRCNLLPTSGCLGIEQHCMISGHSGVPVLAERLCGSVATWCVRRQKREACPRPLSGFHTCDPPLLASVAVSAQKTEARHRPGPTLYVETFDVVRHACCAGAHGGGETRAQDILEQPSWSRLHAHMALFANL